MNRDAPQPINKPNRAQPMSPQRTVGWFMRFLSSATTGMSAAKRFTKSGLEEKKRGQGRQSLQDARKDSKKGMEKLKSRRDSTKSRHDSIKSRRDSMESRRDFSFCMPLRQFFRAGQTHLSRGMRKNMRRQGCPSSPVLMLFLSDYGLCWGQTFLVCVLIIPQICSIFHPHKVIISGVLSKFAAVKL